MYNDICDTMFLGYTNIPWSQNRAVLAIPTPICLAFIHSIDLKTHFQVKIFSISTIVHLVTMISHNGADLLIEFFLIFSQTFDFIKYAHTSTN